MRRGDRRAKAVTHLIRLGHRRIGCLLGAERYIPTVRSSAATARRSPPTASPSPTEPSSTRRSRSRAGAPAPPGCSSAGCTAMICGNDLMALGAVLAANTDHGRSHTDVSVVGYDGTEFTTHTHPTAHHAPSAVRGHGAPRVRRGRQRGRGHQPLPRPLRVRASVAVTRVDAPGPPRDGERIHRVTREIEFAVRSLSAGGSIEQWWYAPTRRLHPPGGTPCSRPCASKTGTPSVRSSR